MLYGFETPGPQQDFLVELRRLQLGGDPVNLLCKESDRGGRGEGQIQGTVDQQMLRPGSQSLFTLLPPRPFPFYRWLTVSLGSRATGGPVAGIAA